MVGGEECVPIKYIGKINRKTHFMFGSDAPVLLSLFNHARGESYWMAPSSYPRTPLKDMYICGKFNIEPYHDYSMFLFENSQHVICVVLFMIVD